VSNILVANRRLSFPETPISGRLGDLYWDSTSGLLHCNGSGSTFTDEKGHVFTAVGGQTIATDNPKFGDGNLSNTGAAAKCIKSANFPEANFADADFTIEAWIYLSTGGSNNGIMGKRNSASNNGWLFWVNGASAVNFAATSTGSSYDLNFGGGSFGGGAYHHVAVTRNGRLFTIWYDGTSAATATSSLIILRNTEDLAIGAWASDATAPWTGYQDEVRITYGVARYTQPFRVPQQPFPNYGLYYNPSRALPSTASVTLQYLRNAGIGGHRIFSS